MSLPLSAKIGATLGTSVPTTTPVDMMARVMSSAGIDQRALDAPAQIEPPLQRIGEIGERGADIADRFPATHDVELFLVEGRRSCATALPTARRRRRCAEDVGGELRLRRLAVWLAISRRL